MKKNYKETYKQMASPANGKKKECIITFRFVWHKLEKFKQCSHKFLFSICWYYENYNAYLQQFLLSKEHFGSKGSCEIGENVTKTSGCFFSISRHTVILFKFSNCFYNIFSQRALLLFLSICKFYIIVYFQNYN